MLFVMTAVEKSGVAFQTLKAARGKIVESCQESCGFGADPMGEDIPAQLKKIMVIPVLTLPDADAAEPLAFALAAGGLSCAEVTFRTPAAPEAIRRMAGIPGILVGAGTVTTPVQVRQAFDLGARFVVSPGFSPSVAAECRKLGLFALPGVCTPTEIMAAAAEGFSMVKFFPAEAFGGVKTLKALCGPFAGIDFVPTGGITAGNLREYLALPRVAACGASWMAEPALLAGRDWAEIERRARAASELAFRR